MLMTNCLLRKCPKKHQSTEITNYYCPLELPFIAHRLQTMKKGEDRKKKKRFVWLLSRLFNRMLFHCFCKCVLHVYIHVSLYILIAEIMYFLYLKKI